MSPGHPPPFFKTFTFFISCSTCCACKPRVRWTELHFSKGKLLSATRKKAYTQGTLLPSPCTLYISSCLTSPIHCEDMTRDEWTLGHEHVCLCVARRSRRGSWGIQSLTQRSRDRRADTFQAWYNPSGIHEWNDRITGVLENLLRWLIMLFMVGRHTARREKSNCLTNENMDKLFTHSHQTANLRREVFLSISTHGLVLTSINADTWKFESVVLLQTDLLK